MTLRCAVACSCHHSVQVHQMTQPEGGSAGFYDVTMQTLEVSASAHFDFGSSVSSFGESGCGSRTSLDVVHVLAFGVDFVP